MIECKKRCNAQNVYVVGEGYLCKTGVIEENVRYPSMLPTSCGTLSLTLAVRLCSSGFSESPEMGRSGGSQLWTPHVNGGTFWCLLGVRKIERDFCCLWPLNMCTLCFFIATASVQGFLGLRQSACLNFGAVLKFLSKIEVLP